MHKSNVIAVDWCEAGLFAFSVSIEFVPSLDIPSLVSSNPCRYVYLRLEKSVALR